MTETILSFLQTNNFMNVACVDEEGFPYSFSCFYAFDNEKKILLFTSSPDGTKHVPLLHKNKKVSGTILPDCMKVDAISGIQFTGDILHPHEIQTNSKNLLLGKFPIIEKYTHEFWAIKVDFIKLTDNSKGFGFKEIWKEEKNF